MTKRAPQKFERRPQDKYYTPPDAIYPLLPHLKPRTRFIEPCAGDGRLARFLNLKGHRCVFACDVLPEASGIHRMNALDVDERVVRPLRAGMFITNPPWDRPVLHTLIRHLTSLLPTWLLFDADWAFTDLARKHGTKCAKIVTVGRVRWIEDSPHSGLDNAAWFLFDESHRGAPKFFWKS